MTNLSKSRSVFSSPLVIYALAAAFIFTLGFFIHFGREAEASKSWKYVMFDGDPSYYWSIAKGRMMTPRCDGNPYYFEEQGLRHIIPFTTAEVVGLLSKYSKIPLSWFFPAWQILMPLLMWLVLTLCCWKLWKYPLDVCAPGTLLLLLLLLYCPWVGLKITLLRFSRPMDGIAPLFLWISLIFKGDPDNKKHRVAIMLASALTLWLHPFNAVFGLWATGFEFVYFLIRRERFRRAALFLFAIGSCLLSGLIYAAYAFIGKNISAAIISPPIPRPVPAVYFLVMILTVLCIAGVVHFFCRRLNKSATALDRLVLVWFVFGLFICGISEFVPNLQETRTHLLYFSVIMIFSMAGWIHEKLCALKEVRLFSKFSIAFIVVSVAGLLFSGVVGKNFFTISSEIYSIYVSQYFLVLIFFLWMLERFGLVRRFVRRKGVLWSIILLVAVVEYWKFPVYSYNRNFPFDGGYKWLKRHAQKNEVVLTATADSMFGQYLFLETGLKPYFYIHGGSYFSSKQEYRRDFVMGLLLGMLGQTPLAMGDSIEQRLRVFRLDYILMPKPSPFYGAITSQLQGHLLEVYQDPQCLLWRVM